MLLVPLSILASCTPDDQPEETKDKILPVNAVDLGLSVKWADKNLGAESASATGYYFAWGETKSKETYSWENYKWGNSSTTLTKYCASADYGTVDKKTVLEAADDIASVGLGGKWRMPTADEWEELRTSCTWTQDTVDGVFGYKVSVKDGNASIFIPAAGGYDGAEVYRQDAAGFYWSSSLYTKKSSLVEVMYFIPGAMTISQAPRYYGLPVRAVLAE